MWVALGTIAIVAACIGIGVAIDRRFGVLPAGSPRARLLPHAPGEAPGSAIRAARGELARLRHDRRCSRCRAALDADPDPPDGDRVSYDGRELIVLVVVCARCSTRNRIYVDPIA